MDFKGLRKAMERFLQLDHVDPEVGVPGIDQDGLVAAFVGEIQGEFRRRVEERRPYELQWRLNQNFVNGNQYCDIFLTTGMVEDLPLTYAAEMRSVYNQIAPIEEIRLSKLSRVRPGLVVRPMTSDTSDITSARVSTRILKAAYEDQGMSQKLDDLMIWAENNGGCLMKSVWDPREGMRVGMVDGREIFEGDLSTVIVPYYEFFPSSNFETDLQKMDSIIHAKVYTVDEIWSRWGVQLEGKDLNVYAINTTGVAAGGTGFIASMSTVTEEIQRDSELVIEYFERPNAVFPNGRHAIIAGDYCVHLGELKFRVGKHNRLGYPFTHQKCLKRAGTFWGATVVERCIQLQRDYNATQNMINEYLARMGIGNLVYEEGSLIDDSIIDQGLAPGQPIEYMQGFKPPQWLTPEEVPVTLTNRVADLRQEFIIMSGVSEMARTSQSPAAISSGTALEILKEQDDTRLALTAENMHAFMRETGTHWLRLFKQFVGEQRVSRVVGDSFSDTYVFVWDRNAITSEDVIVDAENEMLNTPAQRRAHALELLQAGLFNDPDTGRLTREGRAKVLEIYKLGNTESMIDLDEMQTANAQRENVLVMYGGEAEIMPFDNHSLHQAEHMRFALGAEFRELYEKDRAAAMKFLAHLDEHKAIAVEQAMALSGQGSAPSMVANGAPLDQAVSAEAQNIGSAGAGQ